jgi:hypothetical protein
MKTGKLVAALAVVTAMLVAATTPASANVGNVKVHTDYFNENVANIKAGSNTHMFVSFTPTVALGSGSIIDITGPTGMVMPSSRFAYQVDTGTSGFSVESITRYQGNRGVLLTMHSSFNAAANNRITVHIGTGNGSPTQPQTAGSKTVFVATSAEVIPVESASYSIGPNDPANLSATSGANQSTTVGTAFTDPLTMKVTDQYGNAISGANVDVDFPSTAPSGLFTTPVDSQEFTGTTDSSGEVTTGPFRARENAGAWTATATSGSLSAEVGFTNTPDDPDSFEVINGDDQSTKVGQAFGQALQVQIKDQHGNPVPGENVAFTAPGDGPSGSFPDDTQPLVTNSNGIASPTTVRANGVPGEWDVTATHSTLGSLTFDMTNLVGDPAALELLGGGGQSATVGTAFADPLEVAVEDEFGNRLSGVDVDLTLPATGPSATFPGGTRTFSATSGAEGTVTGPAMTANGTAGNWLAQAEAAGTNTLTAGLTNTAVPIPPDTRAPVATITAKPKPKVKTKKKRVKVQFRFAADETGSTFECRLDGGALASCASPKAYTVGKGKHTFEVRATDAAGNTGALATASFKVVKKKKRR